MSDIVLTSGARLRLVDFVDLLNIWANHFEAGEHVQLTDQCADLVTSLKFHQANQIKKVAL